MILTSHVTQSNTSNTMRLRHNLVKSMVGIK